MDCGGGDGEVATREVVAEVEMGNGEANHWNGVKRKSMICRVEKSR